MLQILAACPSCKTQYDTAGKMPGDQFACRCGATVVVPRPRLKDALVVRCSNCGASLSDHKTNCEFCDARLSSKSQGWHKICPDCFCRLPNDANFCVECGVKIDPQKLDEIRADRPCPRCKEPLQARRVNELDLLECAGCGGTWVPQEHFDSLVSAKAEEGRTRGLTRLSIGRLEKAPKKTLSSDEIVKYVPCPCCNNLMNRRNFGRVSGIIIDLCDEHGVWLDYQELNQIVLFVEKGGLERTKRLEIEEAHDARLGRHRNAIRNAERNRTRSPMMPILPDLERKRSVRPTLMVDDALASALDFLGSWLSKRR